MLSLPVWRVEFEILGNLAFPTIAVRQQALLVVVELFARLGGKFEIGAFHDRVHRTRFLAQAAVDALHHVDVVARRATAAVGARLGLDRDRLRRTNRLAELAGDAALL